MHRGRFPPPLTKSRHTFTEEGNGQEYRSVCHQNPGNFYRTGFPNSAGSISTYLWLCKNTQFVSSYHFLQIVLQEVKPTIFWIVLQPYLKLKPVHLHFMKWQSQILTSIFTYTTPLWSRACIFKLPFLFLLSHYYTPNQTPEGKHLLSICHTPDTKASPQVPSSLQALPFCVPGRSP